MTSEGRDRFLRLIAERVPPERIAEVHLFPALRQGGTESGVAVIAARAADALGEGPSAPDDSYLDTDAPLTREDPAPAVPAVEPPNDAPPTGASGAERLTIYRAHYRLTLKGAERGKWEADVTAEADAPLSTVDEVVRGVHRRAGEGAEPERMSGATFRAAVADEPWTTPR